MTSTFGEISYNDEIYSDKKTTNSKDLFMRLDEGDNELRLLTNPFQYSVHKVKKDPSNPKDFGQKVPCSAIHGSCPVCASGDKAKLRWLYGVLSRKTGTYKILDVSFAVFSQIRKLARKADRWGDPTKYDLNIVVDKNGGATGYYSVQPIPKEPLSAEDQKVKDDVDFDDLKRRVTPPTSDVVQKRLDKIFGEGEAIPTAAPAAAKKAAAKPVVKANTKTAPVSMADDEELEESFPDYDNQA
jgi:hypothetical protein